MLGRYTDLENDRCLLMNPEIAAVAVLRCAASNLFLLVC